MRRPFFRIFFIYRATISSRNLAVANEWLVIEISLPCSVALILCDALMHFQALRVSMFSNVCDNLLRFQTYSRKRNLRSHEPKSPPPARPPTANHPRKGDRRTGKDRTGQTDRQEDRLAGRQTDNERHAAWQRSRCGGAGREAGQTAPDGRFGKVAEEQSSH